MANVHDKDNSGSPSTITDELVDKWIRRFLKTAASKYFVYNVNLVPCRVWSSVQAGGWPGTAPRWC